MSIYYYEYLAQSYFCLIALPSPSVSLEFFLNYEVKQVCSCDIWRLCFCSNFNWLVWVRERYKRLLSAMSTHQTLSQHDVTSHGSSFCVYINIGHGWWWKRRRAHLHLQTHPALQHKKIDINHVDQRWSEFMKHYVASIRPCATMHLIMFTNLKVNLIYFKISEHLSVMISPNICDEEQATFLDKILMSGKLCTKVSLTNRAPTAGFILTRTTESLLDSDLKRVWFEQQTNTSSEKNDEATCFQSESWEHFYLVSTKTHWGDWMLLSFIQCFHIPGLTASPTSWFWITLGGSHPASVQLLFISLQLAFGFLWIFQWETV